MTISEVSELVKKEMKENKAVVEQLKATLNNVEKKIATNGHILEANGKKIEEIKKKLE